MGKLEKIIESGVFIGNPEFNSLLNDFLASTATAAFQKGKSKALRKDAAKSGSKKSARFALEMNALKAWHEQKICEADRELSKFHLKNWLREQAKAVKKAAEAEEKAASARATKAKKAAKIDKQTMAEIVIPEPATPKKAVSASRKSKSSNAAKTPKTGKISPAEIETTNQAPADSRRLTTRRPRAVAKVVPVN